MTGPDIFHEIAAGWHPDPVERTEVLDAAPALALAGLFDVPPPATRPGDPLPPLWHWLYLLDRPAQRELAEDGHPRDALFVPPIPARRRMFGGGRVDFPAPLRIGAEVTRRSELADARVREGGSGWLLLVTVRHTLSVGGRPAAVEDQDIVYRQPGDPRSARPAAADSPPADDWALRLRPDPTLLFRFSALTYNAHRIHYDRDYAASEGYPDLVVHGPLLALAMLELPRRYAPDRRVTRFAYRLRAPLFAPHEVVVTGTPGASSAELRVGAAATGTADFAP